MADQHRPANGTAKLRLVVVALLSLVGMLLLAALGFTALGDREATQKTLDKVPLLHPWEQM